VSLPPPDGVTPLDGVTRGGAPSDATKKHRFIVRCEMFFDTFICLHVTRECKERTDGRTDRPTDIIIENDTLNYVARTLKPNIKN